MLEFQKINWEDLDCAYSNAVKEIPKTLSKIQTTRNKEELTCLLCELIGNVNHQCDFYDSTMVVMYYMTEFIKQRSDDLEYSMTLVSYFGTFYCWEIHVDTNESIKQLYNESVSYAKNYLLYLLQNRYEEIAKFSQNNVELSLSAFLSLLDTNPYHKIMAQQFCYGEFEELPILCMKCEFEDETLGINDSSLQKADIVDYANWNHTDFSNTALWMKALYHNELENKMVSWALTIAGIFTCPNCKEKQPTIVCIDNFMESC